MTTQTPMPWTSGLKRQGRPFPKNGSKTSTKRRLRANFTPRRSAKLWLDAKLRVSASPQTFSSSIARRCAEIILTCTLIRVRVRLLLEWMNNSNTQKVKRGSWKVTTAVDSRLSITGGRSRLNRVMLTSSVTSHPWLQTFKSLKPEMLILVATTSGRIAKTL